VNRICILVNPMYVLVGRFTNETGQKPSSMDVLRKYKHKQFIQVTRYGRNKTDNKKTDHFYVRLAPTEALQLVLLWLTVQNSPK